MFEIVYLLQGRGMVPAKELAQRFEVSVRTIYRDVEALSQAGIPVYASQGRGGGIGLSERFVLNKSVLSSQEREEIISALQGLSATGASDSGQALRKLSALFGGEQASWIDVDFSGWGMDDSERFQQLRAAILQRQAVSFTYYAADGASSQRTVEPIQLWFKHHTWYLRAFCLTRQDSRLFRLTRIHNLGLTGQSFPPRDVPAQPSAPPSPNVVVLQLHLAPQAAFRVYDEYSPGDITRNPDGSFIVTAHYGEDDWLYGHILSYGPMARVLSPEHVRQETVRRLAAALGQYEI